MSGVFVILSVMSENPFKPTTRVENTSREANVELVNEMLSPEDAKRYAALTEKRAPLQAPLQDESLTPEEKIVTEEQEGFWGRKDYIAWAKTLGEDAVWVDQNFTFKDDGTVETIHDLEMHGGPLSTIPPNLVKVNGNLRLHTTRIKELILPKEVTGNIWCSDLMFVEHLVFPEIVGGSLVLPQLESVWEVAFPERVPGNLDLRKLKNVSTKMVLPKVVSGTLYLNYLATAENIIFPNEVNNLFLNSLKKGEGIILPESVHGNLYMNNISNAEGVTFPKVIEKSLFLGSLWRIKGFIPPLEVQNISFTTLWSFQRRMLVKKYPHLKGKTTADYSEKVI